MMDNLATDTTRTFLRNAARVLSEAYATDSDVTNNNTTGIVADIFSNSTTNSTEASLETYDVGTEFDPKVFWSVNAFILVMVMGMAVFCYYSDKTWITNPEERRRQSDDVYRAALRERLEQEAERRKETPEQRTRKLLQSFRRHKVQMTVKEGDLLIDLESAEFMIPKPGQQTSDLMDDIGMGGIDPSMSSIGGENKGCLKLPHQEQPVPNCCAVCLGSYHVGDEVVWSSNPRCAHAFHQECILEWLVKMQPSTPCPCCRQEFTDLETIRKEKKIQWSGVAFNPSAVTF